MTIIVLLNASAIPIYAEVMGLNPRRVKEIKNPKPKVRIICAMPIKREEVPISLITLGFRCSPTIKSRKAIPNFKKLQKLQIVLLPAEEKLNPFIALFSYKKIKQV